jgi:hypothetical protein
MELGSYFLFLQEQIKDIIIIKKLESVKDHEGTQTHKEDANLQMNQSDMKEAVKTAILEHDCAPGAGAENCITSIHRLWRAELVISPHCRPTRRRVFPDQLSAQTVAGCWLG